ncbi:MAG: saccharopine dehydrogenase NADP-binding domain-containing protein [Chloroflexota bacterium]
MTSLNEGAQVENTSKKKVVILGGYGSFGSLISQELVSSTAQIFVAGRNRKVGQPFARSIGAEFVQCDSQNISSLEQAFTDAYLVINAAGPFQASDYTIPETTIRLGCHYIDLGDGRNYVANISKLHQAAQRKNLFVCVGASTTPAVTSAAVIELQKQMPQIQSIEIALNAGNKNPAGVSTIASILSYVGVPVKVWQNQRWQTVNGWSQGQFVNFPAPVGKRRVQLCDVPDLQLFPKRFDASSVMFKAGVEITLFNYAIALLGQLKQVWPSVNLPRLSKPLVTLSQLFKSFGTLAGCCAVWVTDHQGEQRAIAFVAPSNGPRIPTAPAVLLSRKILDGFPFEPGAYPCVGFITLDEYRTYLQPFGISINQGHNNVWLA